MTTQQMTGRTMSMTLDNSRASHTASATRSLRLAERLRDQGRSDEYLTALTTHFSEFGGRTACQLG